ncbi:MAG: lysophospholipid acyltransferase family protein [bacterium]
MLATTWRYRVINGSVVGAAHDEGKRVIYALWHGELLPLLWLHRSQDIALVISEHRDGEIIARIAETLGYATIRGSSSRGGSRALIGLMRELEGGRDAAVTPDGPRGPAHVFAPGAAIAAQRTGALIVPIRASASRAWRLKSWDRFLVPKPFARVEVVYGEPVSVLASSPREAAEHAPRLQALLESVPGTDP